MNSVSGEKPRSILVLVAALAVAALAGVVLSRYAPLAREQVFMSAILVLGIALWVTEAIPLFATSLLIIGLQVILIANPGGWSGLGFATGEAPSYRQIFNAAADPILLLFFGGFLLARAVVNEGVDRALAAVLLRPFGSAPRHILLGVLVVTMIFSMWMSNTATAAMMLAVVSPMLEACPARDRFRKALLLAVAFGANLGGLGTPIASPPNALALSLLQRSGFTVSFLNWMLVAIPLAVGLCFFTWLLLWKWFPPSVSGLRFEFPQAPLSDRGRNVLRIFALTLVLWVSDYWTGIPTPVVALVPAILLTGTGLITARDLGRIEWSVLLLVAGGISLGAGMQLTGLDRILVDVLPVHRVSGYGLLAILVVGTILLGTFMSNTAAANLLLPVGIAAAMATGTGGISVTQAALSIALAASISMALPISTPPNAMAYARGEFSARDLAKAGLLIGVAAALAILFAGGWIIRIVGITR